VDLFDLGIQNAGDFHFLSLESMHQIVAIKPEDVCAGRQDEGSPPNT
jgi:hypothetical protein